MVTLPQWKAHRQKCRTDIFWLCKVLHYDDVTPEVHGKMVGMLQEFVGGLDDGGRDNGNGELNLKGMKYTPAVPMWNLTGPRRTLIITPRGSLKTSVLTIAYAIQAILNYPDIRILISTATQKQATAIVGEMEDQFRLNEDLRFAFPDYCPQGKNVKDWGTQESFTCPARKSPRKEPSVSICTIGSVVAGGHFDMILNDDLVDKENVRTPDQIETVKQHFASLGPLLETSSIAPYRGWLQIVGTPYDFSDLTCSIRDAEAGLAADKKTWHILVQSAKNPDGSLFWPERITQSLLDEIERDPLRGPEHLAAQYLCDPIPSKGGLLEDAKQIQWIPRHVLKELQPKLRLHTTIDLHGMEPGAKGSDNDYTVLTVCGFGPDGRPYVFEIRRGRFTPDEVINHVFEIHGRYPAMVDFKIEKDAHARVLLPFLRREMERRGRYPLVTPIRRDNRVSKVQRIKGLQPWLRNGDIRFADDLPCKLDLINEIMRFPKYSHDDILDTLADQLQNRDGLLNYDVVPAPRAQGDRPIIPRFLGFGENGRPLYAGQQEEDVSKCDTMTGW